MWNRKSNRGSKEPSKIRIIMRKLFLREIESRKTVG